MEFANINDTMRTAKEEDKRFVPLFGTETFRSLLPSRGAHRHALSPVA
jgi:hypothetical protein